MKRSLKHHGSAALRVGAALGLTTVGVVAVGAAPAFAQNTSNPATAITKMVYTATTTPTPLYTITVTANGTLAPAPAGVGGYALQVFPPSGGTSYVVDLVTTPSSDSAVATLPGPLESGATVDFIQYPPNGPLSSPALTDLGNSVWTLNANATLVPVNTSAFASTDYPSVTVPPQYSLNATDQLANAVVSFSGPESGYTDSNVGAKLDGFTVTVLNKSGAVVGGPNTVSPKGTGSYSTNFSGLTPGQEYSYLVSADYSSTTDSTAAPVPLTTTYVSTLPSAKDLTPQLPQVQGMTATPTYKDQSTFANPQETISWDSVAATTAKEEGYTPVGYQVSYASTAGTPTTQTVAYVGSDTTQSAAFDVSQGLTYNYSVSVIWSNGNGTFTGAPQTGTFLANSSLGAPTLTSLSSAETGASTLQVSGSFNTPAMPSQGAAGINAQYQIVLTDGSRTYSYYQTPVSLGWGQSLDFSVSSNEFPMAVGDTVTATVEATFYDGASEVGISNSNPSTITITNQAQLPGPQNVVFAMSQDLGGTVSWTGPTTKDVPSGYALNGFTVEIVNPDNNGQVYWVDNNVGASATSTAYNLAIPAGITSGFASSTTYEALVYANYTDTAEASQTTVGASASDSLYMPTQSLLSLTAPSMETEYANGAPALNVSWNASPSIPLSDGTGSITPSSYTLLYAPLDTLTSTANNPVLALSSLKTVVGIAPGAHGGVTSTTLTGLTPGTEYGVIVLARYPLYEATSGTFVGSATLPGLATTYAALPQPSISSLGFSSTGGSLDLTVAGQTPQATNPSGLSATYSIKVSNQATGMSYTYGPFANSKSTFSETLQSSSKSLLFGVGQNLNVTVIASYSLNGSAVGSVSSSPKQDSVTDSALELPGVSNIAATVVNDQNGNPTMANLSFEAPTGSTSPGWTIKGYDVVATGTNGVPAATAYFPASGTTGASSNVAAFDCTQGNCSVLVDGLIASYTYGITVMPVYVNGSNDALGASATLAGNLTMNQGLSTGVSNIVLSPGSTSSMPSMSASWEPPGAGSTSGLSVTGYQVQLYKDGTTTNVAVGAPVTVTTTSTFFTDLNEADTYSIGVTTLLKGANGAVIYGPTVYSGNEAEAQNLATAPVENVNLQATDSETGALNISWQVQAGDGYAKPESFVIKLTAGSYAAGSTTVAVGALASTTAGGVTTYTDTLTDLNPADLYSATVVPYSGVGGTGVAGMPGTSPAGATPYSTEVSNASVTNYAPGDVKVSFTGPGSTQYQVSVSDALGNLVVGTEQAGESGSTYSANLSIPQSYEGQTLFVEITPVASSGASGTTFAAPFVAYGAPNPVRNLEPTDIGSTAVSLTWEAPSSASQTASGAVTSYQVTWYAGGAKVGSTTTSDLAATITSLTPGTAYSFEVVALNNSGFSSSPSIVGATPAAGTVSGPLNLTSTPITNGLSLSWDAPTSSELGGNSLGSPPAYQVTLTNTVTKGSQTFDVSTDSYQVSGLTDGDPYTVSVRAQVVSATTGNDFWSSAATLGADTATTPVVAPNAVTGLHALVSGGQVLVTWNRVSGATDYRVSVDGAAPVSTNDANAYAFAATAGQEYTVEVFAMNGEAQGAPNEVTEFVASGPVMPSIAEVGPNTQVGSTYPSITPPATTHDVAVSFTAPTTIGSAEVSSYTITLYSLNGIQGNSPSPIGTVTVPISAVLQGLNGEIYSQTFADVPDGTTVFANVSANTGANDSVSSQTDSIAVVGRLGAPSAINATPGSHEISLQVNAPLTDNGATPTSLVIYYEGSDGIVHVVNVAHPTVSQQGVWSYTLSGLTNGESYQVWVAFGNQDGEIGQAGQATDVATTGTSLTPYTPFPSTAPTTVVSATPVRSGTVNVGFTALPTVYNPQYVISYHTSGGTIETMVVPSTTTPSGGLYTVPVTGLTNGDSYTFTVTAYAGFVNNSGANGSLTEGSATATPYGLPGSVVVSSLTTVSDGFSMGWSAPADGGTSITGYSYTVSTSTGVADSGTTTSTSLSLSNLTNGTDYTVSIYAMNEVGNGPTTTLSVIPESAAPKVTNLVVTPTAGNASVSLSIPQATEGNSSSAITGYEYQYGPTNVGFDSGWIQVPSTETGTNPIVTDVTGLTNGTEYSFEVRALSGTVASAYPTVDATPTAPAAVVPPSTSPGGVTTITRTITVVEPSTSSLSVTPSTSSSVVDSVPYAMVAADGGYFNHGAPYDNSLPGENIATSDIVGGAPAGTNGYWMVTSNGTVYDFGSAHSFGNVTNLSGKVIGMASTPDGGGYWVATNTGNIYAFGNAADYVGVSKYGITGLTGSRPLNAPIVGIAALPNGNGLYLVAADGGVFNFGSAGLYGTTYSLGLTGLTGSRPLNAPIVGIAVDPEGTGYLLIAADGGVFNLGSAQFQGSTYTYGITGLTGDHPLNAPIIGGAFGPTVNGKQGYYLFAADGGVFNFGSAPYEGSDASLKLAKPMVTGFVFPS
ncbi:fibronectin type III domain-containing protein [Ferrimicrobium sp.]|uniref:beta strand repeat-containing protein n=1 Tax=Ferrimicrobium sp. TaxID=2926050 RepID=UPI00261ECD69|nr:fibronectin type III domain-containing protein [Ferrimicrobium sp.]